jgi:LacI family transcriptional regulator
MEDAYRIVRAANAARSFTAIIALSDVMAAAAWKALTDGGVRVPEDVSLIGYNDTMVTRILSLTTVAQPTREIGRYALALLLDLINGRREPPQRVEMRDSLIIRNSCRKL